MIIILKKTCSIVKESGDDDGGDCNRLSFQGLQGINESSYCLLHMANGAHCLASLCKRIVSITRKGGVNIYTIDHHFKRSSSVIHHIRITRGPFLITCAHPCITCGACLLLGEATGIVA